METHQSRLAKEQVFEQCRVLEPKPCHIPIPSVSTATPRGPAPRDLQHLMPNPSLQCPHCLTRDRLKSWTSASLLIEPPNTPMLTDVEREQVTETMLHTWEEDTCTVYGAGLLMWHCFCNERGPQRRKGASITVPAVCVHHAPGSGVLRQDHSRVPECIRENLPV